MHPPRKRKPRVLEAADRKAVRLRIGITIHTGRTGIEITIPRTRTGTGRRPKVRVRRTIGKRPIRIAVAGKERKE